MKIFGRQSGESCDQCPTVLSACGNEVAIDMTVPGHVCLNCGWQLQVDDMFCANCGTEVTTPAVATPSSPSAVPYPAPAPITGWPARAEHQQDFAAAGETSQNQTYVGNRLMFTRNQDVEVSFVSLITIGMVWSQIKILLLQEFLLWLISVVLFWICYFIGGKDFATLIGILAVIAYFVVFIAWLRSGTQEPISEWELLIDGKSTSADDAYGAIALSLNRRAVPAFVQPQRIVSDVSSGQARNYLTVSRDNFSVYVSVIPFGTGLYVAWSMWRELTTARTIADWFRQRRNRRAGAGGLLNMMLRAEPVRAMREVVHNAVREGVEVALAGTRVDLASAFGGTAPPISRAGSAPKTPSTLPPRPHFATPDNAWPGTGQ